MKLILILITGALILGGLNLTQPLVQATFHPRMHTIDQPRCFPEGTLGTEGFAGCPDSRPALIRT